ncbi:MAG: Mrr restriction system protein [Firmicutes bacterium]|jgi:restriction system protein|nr:Mrr restriction system protein [Bacillota bacterium]
MANVTHKRTGELLRVLFELLIKKPDGLPAREGVEQVRSKIQLTEYEKGYFDSGKQRFDQIIRFATVDCTKAGWLVKQKGTWFITELGIEAYKKFTDPETFHREAARLYRIWKRGNAQVETDTAEIDDSETENNVVVTFENAEEQAWMEIEEFIKNKNPYEFQDMVGDLLTAMGYYVAWISPPGKDGGLDLLAWNDPLGTKPPRIKVQVKRYSEQKINVDTLRSFIAILGDDDIGIIVSTSGFTKDAQVEARTQEKRKVTLIDIGRFFDLWVKFYDKLSDSARSKMPLKQIWFLSPDK